MPKSDTWPGGVAMESLSNMDSAGSGDSVIIMNSGLSGDSMDHLSAEERACLMYLEETIEALEVQEDSGLSSDQPDPGHLSTKTGGMIVDDVSGFKPDESRGDKKSFLRCAQPTPLLLANGVSSLPPKVTGGITDAKTGENPAEPGSRGFPIHHKAEQTLTTPVPAARSSPNVMEMLANIKSEAQVTGSASCPQTPPSAAQTEMLCVPTEGGGNPKLVPIKSPCPGDSKVNPEIDLGLIPPPSDFMDEPCPDPKPEREKDLPLSAHSPDIKPPLSVDLEQLRQKAHMKRASMSSPVTEEPPSKPPAEVPTSPIAPAPTTFGTHINLPPEVAEPRSPPAVAPKPKKLPSNIILKSHKASAAGSDSNLGHPSPSPTDRQMLDPQRVRREALRKLGLLKSDDTDSGPVLSPILSPQSRRSWASPASPLSPAAPHTPTSPSIPSSAHVSSPPPASVLLPSLTPTNTSATSAAAVQAPGTLPAPPATFCDPMKRLGSDDKLSAVKDVSEATSDVKVKVDTPPLTPPALAKQSTPPRTTGVKSATLERSGLGLSSYIASEGSSDAERSLKSLRNSRPRPASLGSGRPFSSSQGESSVAGNAAGKDPDPQRSSPAHAATPNSGDSQALPRSYGISVLICPRAQNGENRREALKKLGLLRD
ncbi:specifically androgen-regulated gene protein [Genypterus blacodes]|uniref:specifically androgen-regulated gene protein n=1 Tax=Genypterus blacodes TaxID=154954 RepID=UPI003F76AF26